KEIEDILTGIHDQHGTELAMAIRKNALNRSQWEDGMAMLDREGDWDRFPEDVLIYASLPRFPAEWDHFVVKEGYSQHTAIAKTEFNGKSWHTLVTPLTDVSGAEVGNLLIFFDVSETEAQFNRLFAVTSGAALVFLAALFGFLYVVLRRGDQALLTREMDLARSEGFQRTLIETLPDFIFVLDANGTILRVNRVQPGHREEDVVGQKAEMFVSPEYRDVFEKTFRQVVDTGQIQTIETAVNLPDGRHYFINRLNQITLAGEENLVILVSTDITARKQAEEERKNFQQKVIETQ
ncbi:MAG: PAS domain S-box protein, partial [Proteobacteria bacterium]|nr:PAS domain S-box protein [Pseudomonadota bacterium]